VLPAERQSKWASCYLHVTMHWMVGIVQIKETKILTFVRCFIRIIHGPKRYSLRIVYK